MERMVLLVRISKSSNHGTIQQAQTMHQSLHQGFERGLRFESTKASSGQCEVRTQQRSQGSKSFIRKPRTLSGPALRITQHTSKSGCRLKSWLPLKPMANIPLASVGAGLHARPRASHSFAVAMKASFPSKAVSAARASRSRRMALLAA